MTMNARRTFHLTHFGPLFLTALCGWTAFHLVNSGTAYLLPGVIVAGLLAYIGTLVTLHFRTEAHDLRASYSPAYPARTYTPVAMSRSVLPMQARTWHGDMDIAAGD
jgi:hypothetical protein